MFNLVYIFVFQKKLSKAVKLFDAGEIDRYMEALEHLRRSAKGKYLNHLYAINLSAGYCEWKQYDRAIALLEPLSATRFSNRMVKMVHHLNLCMCYFYNDQTDEALALYESSQTIFEPFRKNGQCGGNIAVLDILAAIAGKDYEHAADLLKIARETWPNPHLEDDYAYCEEAINQSRRTT